MASLLTLPLIPHVFLMSEGMCAVCLLDKDIYISKCHLPLMTEQYDLETRQVKKSVKGGGGTIMLWPPHGLVAKSLRFFPVRFIIANR